MNRKTETASFRLDKDNLEKLRKEAETKKISLNVLLNQVIDNHVNFRSVAVPAGFLSFPKPVLVRIMEKLSEKEAKEIGREHFEKDVESICMMLRNRFDADTFMETVEYWLKDCNITYRHDVVGQIHKYLIFHELGKNWSLYISEFIGKTIESLTGRKVISKLTNEIVSFSIDKSKIIES